MSEVELVIDSQSTLGEGPMWDGDTGLFYWVDIMGNCFHSLNPATNEHHRYDIGQPVGTVVLRQRGGFVLALRDGLAFYDTVTNQLEPIIDPEADKPESRFNDGAVDRQGRFWAGTMGKGEGLGTLYRLDTDLSLHTLVTGVTTSNGLGWSPDNTIFYYCDSGPKTIYKYDYDSATGAIENRRVFLQVPQDEGSPDGLTVDSEGFIWSARWGGWKVARFDPDGKLEREIPVPAAKVTSCVFGGADLTDLYITTARTGLSEEELQEQPLAGGVFRLQTGIKGLPEPKFAG